MQWRSFSVFRSARALPIFSKNHEKRAIFSILILKLGFGHYQYFSGTTNVESLATPLIDNKGVVVGGQSGGSRPKLSPRKGEISPILSGSWGQLPPLWLPTTTPLLSINDLLMISGIFDKLKVEK